MLIQDPSISSALPHQLSTKTPFDAVHWLKQVKRRSAEQAQCGPLVIAVYGSGSLCSHSEPKLHDKVCCEML